MNETQKKSNSGPVLLALFAVTVIGAGLWAYLEFNTDVMLNREKAMKYAAAYEKRCQGSFDPQTCRKMAGLHHATCLHDAAMAARGNEEVEFKNYLACMVARESERSL